MAITGALESSTKITRRPLAKVVSLYSTRRACAIEVAASAQTNKALRRVLCILINETRGINQSCRIAIAGQSPAGCYRSLGKIDSNLYRNSSRCQATLRQRISALQPTALTPAAIQAVA